MPKKKDGLTAVQLKQIAARLPGTTTNVYTLSRTLFGIEFQDEDWGRLRETHNLKRCPACSVWKDTGEFPSTDDNPGVCSGCLVE